MFKIKQYLSTSVNQGPYLPTRLVPCHILVHPPLYKNEERLKLTIQKEKAAMLFQGIIIGSFGLASVQVLEEDMKISYLI